MTTLTNAQMNALKAFIETLLKEHRKLIEEFIPVKAGALIGDVHAQKRAQDLKARIDVLEGIKEDFVQADTFDKLLAAAKKAQNLITPKE